MDVFRALSQSEIDLLESAGCTAEDWSAIQVGKGFEPQRLRDAHFGGHVSIGSLQGNLTGSGGVEIPAGIYNATVINCSIGDNSRIARVGGHIANCTIGEDVLIADVGTMATNAEATFGNGIEIETVNEGGGREVRIFNEMSSQFAYLCAMYRYHQKLVERLEAMVDDYTEKVRANRATVGAGAVITHVGEVVDVCIGPHATVSGAARLENGTILSENQAPTLVGAGVTARDFIISEGSTVEDGVFLSRVFVGQGVKLGKQYSAENSLFFANCEGFHGEACAIFAGPYTVSHHKSTLMIAGIYSFYNAGSGTNQSNHMYKLGPLHQGAVQRGSKTGSFSYMLWPSVLGPFSVVIGKHMNNFDTGDLPFSYIIDDHGESLLTPAMNMATVGTVRDSEKWPTRDRRRATIKRDLIRFEVYSPYLVQRMLCGEAVLHRLSEETPRDVEQVRYKGVIIRRLLLRTGARNYRNAIDLYLQERVLERVGNAQSVEVLSKSLRPSPDALYSEDWTDVGGLLMSRSRLDDLRQRIESGVIANVDEFHTAFSKASEAYEKDEWAWVRATYQQRHGKSVDTLTIDDLGKMRVACKSASATSIRKVLADAKKEFDETAMIGFGADGGVEEQQADFAAVRGSFAENSFIKKLQQQLQDLQ